MTFNRKSLFCIWLLVTFACLAGRSDAAAWKLSRNIWSEEDEKVYSKFVEAVCDSKYSNLNKFIKDARANPLYGEEDKKFNLSPDCADLPYALRAYVAYKLRLPFSYTSAISGKGGDQRYSRGNKPTSFKDQDYFSSPQNLFSQVTLVNSGYFRMAADSEDSDHYPVKVGKKSILPGTVYYDPDGHVAVVAKVTEDGRVRVIDAHPDRTISKPWFGAKFTRGSKSNGGGFKRWRPIHYTSGGNTVRTRNHNIADYSADDQFQKTFSFRGRTGLGYHEYVRQALTDASVGSDPVRDFAFMMQDLHEDISYRAMAVKLAIEKGIHLRPHPGSLPGNIYGTDGLWEEFSTPSRDARLKVAFREFYDRTRQMILESGQQGSSVGMSLAARLLEKYEELSQRLTVVYTNSAGRDVTLTFADVSARLFDLSFDPYHSVEYRWGAKGEELQSAGDGETKRRLYAQEQRLRNQLERVYNQATPLSMGPEKPIEVDVRSWLTAYLQGHQVDTGMIAINREVVAPVVAEASETVETMPVAADESGIEIVSADAAGDKPEDAGIVVADYEINEEPAPEEPAPQKVSSQVASPAPQSVPAQQTAANKGSSNDLFGSVLDIGDRIAAAVADPAGSFSSQ